ncbi:MAG TPA: ABC transporter permease, partial [Vicinamibacterales bacterium]|nr:ABC transporter permease [Vicinamibacterales bacterium]
MAGTWQQLVLTLRLHFRNRMGLLYGYLFPLVFLAAFWVLYRHDEVPLARHMGELLTVTVLGGACFGLPTTLVSERERGVWRRYRLAPVSIGSLVASTMLGRYFILITAGMMQLAVAMAVGMPAPQHPFELFVAFSAVAFAFLGVGLVLATMADNVPAVQALGQCIFLPMLIVGGVAVPLYVLPEWAQHVSAFFPGRYAVHALQATVTGSGISTARFSLLALVIIGTAGVLAGAMMFRWDAQQRFAVIRGKGWLVVALGAWIAVGVLAERGGRVVSRQASASPSAQPRTDKSAPPAGASRANDANRAGDPEVPVTNPVLTPQERAAAKAAPRAGADEGKKRERPQAGETQRVERERPSISPPKADQAPARAPTVSPSSSAPSAASPSWREVTMEDINRPSTFTGLPPDEGVVTPMSPPDEDPDPAVANELERLRDRLLEWEPGLVEDPVQ